MAAVRSIGGGTDSDKKLDLTNLQSFSPQWPQPLRLTAAIAVQYAGQRCVQRAEALYALLYPDAQTGSARNGGGGGDGGNGAGAGASTAAASNDDDLVQRDEDGNVQGSLQGWDRAQRVRADYDLVNSWRDYSAKFTTATCQHLGITEESLPPGHMTLENIRLASRGRTVAEVDEHQEASTQEAEFEMGTAHASPLHEGTGQRAATVREEEKKVQQQSEKQGGEEGTVEGQDASVEAAEAKATSCEKRASVKRIGGALDEGSDSRNIEVVNELLLVALGLGQHRAEDGSTTLFEQDAIFGDNEARTPSQTDIPTDAKSGEAADDPTQSTASKIAGAEDMGARAWGALRSGVSSIKRGSANLAQQANLPGSATAGQKKSATTKPNEPCHYDARARALIFVATTAMDLSGLDVCMAEKVIAQTIYFIMSDGRSAAKEGGKGDPLSGAQSSPGDGSDETQSERRSWMNRATQGVVNREKGKVNWAKWAAMGAGATVGGVLIGVTGGLAAPLVAPALVGLTGVSFLATTGGVVMMATLLGVGGAGLAGYRVQRRLRGIDRFEFHEVLSPAHEAGMPIPSLHATICCSGLLLKNEAQGRVFQDVFTHTPDARDVFTILAEEATMQQAGEGLRGYVLDTALKSGGQKVGTEVLKHTALAGVAALALPLTAWSAASAALDGVFVQAKSRAYRAGLILADVLRDEVQGHRPVILVGTSLGCVTILTALGELAKQPEEYAHIVDSVFLIGAPASPSPGTLRRARSVVARRFVNAFSSRDMVCRIAAWLGSGISVEEAKAGALPRILGSRAALGVPGVENIDVSDLVPSHFSLNTADVLSPILQRCRAVND